MATTSSRGTPEMSDENESGRLHFTFPQFAWGVSMLVLFVSAWVDLRTRIARIEVQMDVLSDQVKQHQIVDEPEIHRPRVTR